VSDETASRPRPPRPRKPPRRRIPLALASVLIAIALVVGLLVGWAARGDQPPGGLVTETRPVPIITVTVPEAP
jgi:ferric-dicitrate binding protein FerR (iron transport regulator)